MSMIKRATFQVISARMGEIPAPAASHGMVRTAHRWNPAYEPKPGFLYVRSRAISSRTNDNFDNFPAEEIEAAWRTFIGKPVFVNHHNANHRRARGVMIDAVLHQDIAPDGSPDTWVEVLMEVDAMTFPKLAQAIMRKKITRTSMGTSVGLSVCSFCGNEAEDATDFCKHIPAMKGQRIIRTNPDGTREAVLVYEICRKLSFFENSLLMEEPADPTAFLTGLDTSGVEAEAVTAGLLATAALSPQVQRDLERDAMMLPPSAHEQMVAAVKTAAGRRFRVREMYGQYIVWDTLGDHSVQAWPTRHAAQKQARGLNEDYEDRLAHPDEYLGSLCATASTETGDTYRWEAVARRRTAGAIPGLSDLEWEVIANQPHTSPSALKQIARKYLDLHAYERADQVDVYGDMTLSTPGITRINPGLADYMVPEIALGPGGFNVVALLHEVAHVLATGYPWLPQGEGHDARWRTLYASLLNSEAVPGAEPLIEALRGHSASQRTAGGWTINGLPYEDGVWIEVEPDVWYRGWKPNSGEIVSSLYVRRRPDGKWEWEGHVDNWIGAPHQNKPTKGMGHTLEQAKERAEKSLAKSHEFAQRYEERQMENLRRTPGSGFYVETATGEVYGPEPLGSRTSQRTAATGWPQRFSSDGARMTKFQTTSPQGVELTRIEADKGFPDEEKGYPESLGFFTIETATGEEYDSDLSPEAQWYPDLMEDMREWAKEPLGSRTAVAIPDFPEWMITDQFRQYPQRGPEGISYYKGEIDADLWVDCLLYYKDGRLVGVLNHFPQDMGPERKGNVNVLVLPIYRRQGIGTALWREAVARWGVTKEGQDLTDMGQAFIRTVGLLRAAGRTTMTTASATTYLYAQETGGHPSHAIDYTEYEEATEIVPLCGTSATLYPARVDGDGLVEGPGDVTCPDCKRLLLEGHTGSRKTAYTDEESRVARAFLDWFDGRITAQDLARVLDDTQDSESTIVRQLADASPYGHRLTVQEGIPIAEQVVGEGLSPMPPSEASRHTASEQDQSMVYEIEVPGAAGFHPTVQWDESFGKWTCTDSGGSRYATGNSPQVIMRTLKGRFGSGITMRPKTASRHTALGEQRAPRQVDTLRDEACPVCTNPTYDGEVCSMCGYVKPPLIFHDPDVEKAKEVDLHLEKEEEDVDLACDDCGAVYPAKKDEPEATEIVAFLKAVGALPDDEEEEDPEEPTDEEDEEDDGEPKPWEADGPEAPRVVPTPGEELPGDEPESPERQPKSGDLCPNCGVGTLVPKDDLDGIDPAEPSASDDAETQLSEDDTDPALVDEPDEPKEASRHMSIEAQGQRPRRRQAGQGQPQRQRQGQPQGQRPRQALHEQIQAMRDEANDRDRRFGQAFARQAMKIQELARQNHQVAMALADVAAGRKTPRVAALIRQADAANPANAEAIAPETTEDVESQGATSGANDNVTPEATTTVTEQTTVLEENAQAPTDLVDVESLSPESAPASGSEALVPSHDMTQVPTNTQTSDGDVQWSDSTASANRRLMASLRLARLRVQAGLATDEVSDLVLAQSIADGDRPETSINEEIGTLESVVASRKEASNERVPSRRSVPRFQPGTQGTPSLAARTASEEAPASRDIPADVARSVDDSLM